MDFSLFINIPIVNMLGHLPCLLLDILHSVIYVLSSNFRRSLFSSPAAGSFSVLLEVRTATCLSLLVLSIVLLFEPVGVLSLPVTMKPCLVVVKVGGENNLISYCDFYDQVTSDSETETPSVSFDDHLSLRDRERSDTKLTKGFI